MRVQKMSLPSESSLCLIKHHYTDSYSTTLSYLPELTEVARAFFSTAPTWVMKLFTVRNQLVKHLGLKTSNPTKDPDEILRNFEGKIGEQIGFFRVFERTEHELILGEDDSHLNFRVSLLLQPTEQSTVLFVSTTVLFHNSFGKMYFIPVKPFHKLIVRAMLRKMTRHLEENG